MFAECAIKCCPPTHPLRWSLLFSNAGAAKLDVKGVLLVAVEGFLIVLLLPPSVLIGYYFICNFF